MKKAEEYIKIEDTITKKDITNDYEFYYTKEQVIRFIKLVQIEVIEEVTKRCMEEVSTKYNDLGILGLFPSITKQSILTIRRELKKELNET